MLPRDDLFGTGASPFGGGANLFGAPNANLLATPASAAGPKPPATGQPGLQLFAPQGPAPKPAVAKLFEVGTPEETSVLDDFGGPDVGAEDPAKTQALEAEAMARLARLGPAPLLPSVSGRPPPAVDRSHGRAIQSLPPADTQLPFTAMPIRPEQPHEAPEGGELPKDLFGHSKSTTK
jgi:hypothetical protein